VKLFSSGKKKLTSLIYSLSQTTKLYFSENIFLCSGMKRKPDAGITTAGGLVHSNQVELGSVIKAIEQ
jgi:hypothetical protein